MALHTAEPPVWRACPACSAGSDRPRGAARATRWGLWRRRGPDGPPATRSHSPARSAIGTSPGAPPCAPPGPPDMLFLPSRTPFLAAHLPARGCPRVTACTSRGQTDVLWPAFPPPPVDARARRRAPRHPAMLPSLAKPPFAVPGHVLNGRLPHWAATPTGAVSLLAHRGSPNFARACHAIVRGHTEAGQRASQPGGSGGAPPGPGPPPRPPPAE